MTSTSKKTHDDGKTTFGGCVELCILAFVVTAGSGVQDNRRPTGHLGILLNPLQPGDQVAHWELDLTKWKRSDMQGIRMVTWTLVHSSKAIIDFHRYYIRMLKWASVFHLRESVLS